MTDTNQNDQASKKKTLLVLAALALVLLAAVAAWVIPPGINWIVVFGLFLLSVLLLGLATTGDLFGTLINEQKLMSLSRFQMLIWTLLIVSAYLTIAMQRVKSGDVVDPLIIGVDWQVWALLGISTTSLVGTPLLNNNKKAKEPSQAAGTTSATAKAAETLDEPQAEIERNRTGVLYGNPDIKDARLSDMFEGEELANASFIDMGKLQMFFFTMIIASVYAVQLYQLIANNVLTDDVSLPSINQGLLALLGVSNAGYLGTKSITQTPTK
jgi:hypothetical protein